MGDTLDADKARDTTVRCCLKKAIAPGARRASVEPNRVLGIIDDAVVHVSKIAARGAQMVLLTVLRTLDRGDGRLPDDFFGTGVDTFFDQCFKIGLPPAAEPAATPTAKKKQPVTPGEEGTANKYVRQTYSDDEVRRAVAAQTVRRKLGDSNLLVYASQSYETNFMNFFDCELERRILTFIKGVWRWKYPDRREQPPKGTRFKCFRVASEPWNDRLAVPECLPEDVANKVLACRRRYGDIVDSERSRREAIKRDAVEVTRRLAASQKTEADRAEAAKRRKDLKRRREALRQRVVLWRIEFVYWLLREIEALECEWAAGFAMAPLLALQRQHIRVDNTVFSAYLLPQLRTAGYYSASLTANDVQGLESEHLAALFSVGDLRSKRAGWKQGASYQTDGYALCTRFVKNKEPGSGRRSSKVAVSSDAATSSERPRRKKPAKKSSTESRGDAGVRANVGMDQGLVNPYCAAWRDADGTVKHKMLTRSSYYADSGITRHREITRRRERRLQATRQAQSDTRSKTSDWEKVLGYVKTVDEHSARIWEQYADKRLSRSRLVAEMGKVAVLDRWCRDLRSEVVESGVAAPVMGVGYPSFNSSMPGGPSAPTTTAFKALRRHFRTVAVDEYMTSQADPSDPARLLLKPKKRVDVNGETKYREVRGIRLCPESPLEPRASRCYDRDPDLWRGYRRLLRDVVGALNIMAVAGLSNEDRPGLLQRTDRASRRH